MLVVFYAGEKMRPDFYIAFEAALDEFAEAAGSTMRVNSMLDANDTQHSVVRYFTARRALQHLVENELLQISKLDIG